MCSQLQNITKKLSAPQANQSSLMPRVVQLPPLFVPVGANDNIGSYKSLISNLSKPKILKVN